MIPGASARAGAAGGTGRWVTVFNGSRDQYQLPLALSEAGLLEALVTDWYTPADRGWYRAVRRALPERVRGPLERRFAAGLPSARVRAHPLETATQALLGRGGLDASDLRLGRRAGTLARRRGAGLLAYSYYAHGAFDAFGDGAGTRALFQVQVHPAAFRRVLAEEMERAPETRDLLAREPELAGTPERIRQLSAAPLRADLCLVPSAYTGQGLVEQGVEPGRVRVVPYGVDLDVFRPADSPPADPFRVLFVGQLTQRKGLRDLLEAWAALALPRAELVLVGRGLRDRALLAAHEGRFRLETDVHSRARMRELYASSHVFCMPSLVESFGLVYLESLACGTPVIGTPRTGAPDVVTEGESGFVVPASDPGSLAERLRWCYEHRGGGLMEMRAQARAAAERRSWATFRREVREALAPRGP